MTPTTYTRARVRTTTAHVEQPSVSFPDTDLPAIAEHLYALMLRNVATDGFVFNDPTTGEPSKSGCVIAAPSYPRNTPGVDQDYVFNWVRDAAITAIEIAAARTPEGFGAGVQMLIDYVNFAQTCQRNATPSKGHACFTVGGESRTWSEQSDGPALQTLAILKAYPQLDDAGKGVANQVIDVNLQYLLGEYRNPTTNLWEEHQGLSFFARSVQLRCFREIAANSFGINVPGGVDAAIAWLQDALGAHWNGVYYVSMLAPPAPGQAQNPALPPSAGYDPNIDIVCASVYGAVACTDTKLLATAAQLRSQWADQGSASLYPINIADRDRGIGPLLGRYPGDQYDGDVAHPVVGGHPWALCTCSFAELYYQLANAVAQSGRVPLDTLSQPFFAQVGVAAGTDPNAAVEALRAAGDAMLRAVVFHSNHLELSEQFDGTTGYEKSVRNLTWGYASFLSAVRAKTGQGVEG